MPNEILKSFDAYVRSKEFGRMLAAQDGPTGRVAMLANAWKIWEASWLAAWGGIEKAPHA